MSKRKLGLGKVRAKKQKLDTEEKKEDGVIASKAEKGVEQQEKSGKSNEELLTVELANEVNPDDPLSQLCGLWKTWKDGDRNNELILNGIINECDRILRNVVENGGKEDVKLNDNFYGIYAQALCDISKFKPDEEVKDWIDNSIDRIEDGFNKFGEDNIRLKFAKCYILLNRIATQYIAQMNVDSKKEEFQGLKELFQEFIDTWNEAIAECEKQKAFTIFNEGWILEILNIFDDLLDIVDKFGTQMSEVVDSDEEEEVEEEEETEKTGKNKSASKVNASEALQDGDFEISEEHPLYEIQNDDLYNCFWRDNMLKYRDLMGKDVDKKIKKSVHEKLGQSYLMEAEEPIAFFNSYQYDQEDGDDDDAEDDLETKEAAERAQSVARSLVNSAVEQLRETYDEEDPKTWVNIAEALITYGNLLELESEEQENSYKEAERLLRRANNACHGRYQDILDSLVQT